MSNASSRVVSVPGAFLADQLVPGAVPEASEAPGDDLSAQPPRKRFWHPVVAIALAGVTFVGGQIIASIPFVVYPMLRHWTPGQSSDWVNSAYTQFVYVVLVETITVWAIWQFTRLGGLRLRDLGFNRFRAWAIVWALTGFAAYFVIYLVLVTIASSLAPGLKLDQQQQDIGFQQVVGTGQLITTFISLVVLPPIAEELFFRGFLFTSFRFRMGLVASILLTSTLFAIPHLLESAQPGSLLWVGGIDTFTLSVVLCMLREKTGSLWSGILVHGIKNGVAYFALFIVPLLRHGG
jgi:membrane protease YdiL (CAAX protease family)